jgi:lipoate-protein ligase A
MLAVVNHNQNPYFNLALEEYMLKNIDDEVFMLWRNRPSVIIGKHQNAIAEINIDLVRKHNLFVARRLSGGGAVYHDLGNLNYTFIFNGKEENFVNFAKYTKPVLELLHDLGVGAKLHGKSDLMINGLKFSGNAEHIHRKRVLHHGTLLFDSNLRLLSEVLRMSYENYNSNAVKSNPAKVSNIRQHLTEKISVESFRQKIMDFMFARYPAMQLYYLSAKDKEAVYQLVNDKYQNWSWIYGYSPDYEFSKLTSIGDNNIEVKLKVSQGRIDDLAIHSTNASENDLVKISTVLVGLMHDDREILQYIKRKKLDTIFPGISPEEFVSVFF